MTKTTKARKPGAYSGIKENRWGAEVILATFSVLFLLCTGTAQRAQAQTFTTLYNFTGYNSTSPASSDGQWPVGDLVMDSSGNLYGTTVYGGSYNNQWQSSFGSVFELPCSGTPCTYPTEKVLHSFTGGSDGANPTAALVIDSSGNLYGTTSRGGSGDSGSSSDNGTVFELSPFPAGSTAYTERVLYSFTGLGNGLYPGARLLMDSSGDLYSTTYFGGVNDAGTVFKLDTSSGTLTVLHSFDSVGRTGERDLEMMTPMSVSAGLVMGLSGNLYGTTFLGGSGSCSSIGCGTVFEVARPGAEIQALITQVKGLLTAGLINKGQDGSLTKELQDTTKMVNAGKINGAIGNLESFISEVEDLQNSGLLTSDQAASLINSANAVIQQLQASS